MRTTVTLDPEAERLLKEAMRRRGQSFKEVLNQAVLRGLADVDARGDETPFEPESAPMRLLAGHDSGHLNRLNDDLEAQAFVDLTLGLESQSVKR
ncbi:MAG: CopG family transcriptional regulator [Gammaproteobacteria bacterium]